MVPRSSYHQNCVLLEEYECHDTTLFLGLFLASFIQYNFPLGLRLGITFYIIDLDYVLA